MTAGGVGRCGTPAETLPCSVCKVCEWCVCMCVCFYSIVVWNIETKQAICGSPASAHSTGHCLTLQYSNTNDNVFVSAGR